MFSISWAPLDAFARTQSQLKKKQSRAASLPQDQHMKQPTPFYEQFGSRIGRIDLDKSARGGGRVVSPVFVCFA